MRPGRPSASLLPAPGWLAGRGGRPEGYCHRQMIDAVRYLVDNGIKWRAMPSGFPPWPRVYAFFARWRDTGLPAEVTGLFGSLRHAAACWWSRVPHRFGGPRDRRAARPAARGRPQCRRP
ncbi:transposase [Streptomyces sp. NPDC086766]|uniref:transposase n=1 Tax=Streptomyces sp. NPDC086766 TaxID=3365754 RepID=UPI0037FD8227